MTTLNAISYLGVAPEFLALPLVARTGHAIIGRVKMGSRAWLGAGSVIRGDGHYVQIGDDFHIGRGSTIHISHDRYPTVIGNRVTLGSNVVVHACTLGDDVVIGDGAVILDNATIGNGAVIEPNTMVFPSYKLEGANLYAERPAVAVCKLSNADQHHYSKSQREKNIRAEANWDINTYVITKGANAFVGNTVGMRGEIVLEEFASVWYGCYLNARDSTIRLGPWCNVQDNSVLVAKSSGIYIGEHSTIGHNAKLSDCLVGARCLVGMGSHIAEGTEVPDDTFVAAGCVTKPGDKLKSGYLWGGSPARILGEMDDVKREIISSTSIVYAEYAKNLATKFSK